MSRKSKEISALVGLTEAAFVAAQARMAALKRREQELRSMLDELQASRTAKSVAGSSDPATRAGADILWQRWVDSRRSALNMELAQNLGAQAYSRAGLVRDFGRHEATKKILARQKKTARAEQVRRAEQ